MFTFTSARLMPTDIYKHLTGEETSQALLSGTGEARERKQNAGNNI